MSYSLPDYSDKNLQSKIYKKREFYVNRMQSKENLTTYEQKKEYRDKVCGDEEKFGLQTHQALVSNFLNPDTPYNGLLLFHGTGTGKTCAASAIAEKFKQLSNDYEKIYIVVTGPLIKEQWRDEIITKCAAHVYLKDFDSNIGYFDEKEKQNALKQAKIYLNQFFKIISYRSFLKKVLGQKIIKKETIDGKLKKKYLLDTAGEYERDLGRDQITTLNTLVIFDEAHNLTGNDFYKATMKIKKNSPNIKFLLLTATPMKNLADDIIYLINILRPIDSPIERDKVFQGSGSTMTLKPNAEQYLYEMFNGYISYYRGAHPLTYAIRNEIGEIPPGLIFTKVTRCYMEDFQLETYLKIMQETDDALAKKSESAANFVYPGLSPDKKTIIGYNGESGINIIRNQLKNSKDLLLAKLKEKFNINKINGFLSANEKRKTLTGNIYKLENLKHFSTKFATCLNNLNKLYGNNTGTAFIYSNLVVVGVNIFKEILLQNGYLEYNELNDNFYEINDDTIDSITGLTHAEFKTSKHNINDFHPATFMIFTGDNEDSNDEVPEIKMNILRNKFNHVSNRYGKYIKFVIGSRVMNEGITLKNVKEVHILDVHYNFGRVEQVIGRAIRNCVHYKITDENNPEPVVDVYKYVVSLKNKNNGTTAAIPFVLSSEEELYKKAELKFIMVNQIEKIIKKISIDCPLNYNGNILKEEVEKYKDCIPIEEWLKMSEAQRKGKTLCPAVCNFDKCMYKCYDNNYYDEVAKEYKQLTRKQLDYTTFTSLLQRNEIDIVKDKIKYLYKYKESYTLDEIMEKIQKNSDELFDSHFVFKALTELLPTDENDFNNFNNPIYNKQNIPGYLIQRNIYYIFQPLNQNEDVPMFYRINTQSQLTNNFSVFEYLKNITKFTENINKIDSLTNLQTIKQDNNYDFSNIEYYNEKTEFEYVGIIDKPTTKQQNISDDIFKIRTKREKQADRKRGTDMPSLKGAVCNTSKDKNFLNNIAKTLGLKMTSEGKTRTNICNLIRLKLLYLEKYSTKENNLVYVIIPLNHPKYPFPFNLEDRCKYIINEVQKNIPIKLSFDISNVKHGTFEGKTDKDLDKYKITITTKNIDEYKQLLELQGFHNSIMYVE